ncbi:MAG: hypothetical protein ABI477_17485 [Chryseolinea sp.]
MKARKGSLLFAIFVMLTACFSPPEFSTTPEIDFSCIYFRPGNADEPTDSLVVTISFKDGDGDLGLGNFIDDPYQDVFYALGDNGNLVEVSKETKIPGLPQFVKIPPGSKGKLITTRSLQNPLYAAQLPAFVNENESCKDYPRQTIYVSEADAPKILDSSFPNIDTVVTGNLPKYYKVNDLFYKQNNPKHRNIEVEYYIRQSNGEYVLYDWEKEFCEAAFDERFPILTEQEGPLQGNLTYAMTSSGFDEIFSIKTLKLRIRIRDRAFNVSNDVETGDFTLDKIKQKSCR